MPLNIKDSEVHDAARRLAELRGTSITAAVSAAVEEALRKEMARESADKARLVRALDEIALASASLPLLDSRSADEILGYDGSGVPD